MGQVIFAQLVTLTAGAAPANGAPLDPWKLVLGAGPVVMFVLISLVVMSLVCWFIIGAKIVRLGQATRDSAAFLRAFWDPELGNVWNVRRLESLYSGLGGR